jgi:dynein heavy chain
VEPLFLLDLVKAKEDEFAFSTAPTSFVNMIVHLFEKPLDDLAKIPDLEPKILSDLYKAIKNETFIKAPMKPREKPVDPDPKVVPRKLPDENKWIWDIIEEVRNTLLVGIQPLAEYKKSWDEYLDLLKLDPDEFTRNIEMEENAWEVEQIQTEIAQIIEKEKRLRQRLPEKIQVSFFEINCKEMKETLAEKYQTLQKNFIDMIAKRARFQAQAIFNDFQQIQNKIREHPTNIEKLTDIRDYINNLPG